MKKANGNNAVIRSAKIINIISASLMVVAGILLMTVSSMEEVVAQRIMLGILFGLTGAAKIFGYYSNDLYRLAFQYDFAFGIFCEILSLLLILHSLSPLFLTDPPAGLPCV